MRWPALIAFGITLLAIGSVIIVAEEGAVAQASAPLLQTAPMTSPVMQGTGVANGSSSPRVPAGTSQAAPVLQGGVGSAVPQQSSGGAGINGAQINGVGGGSNGVGLNYGQGGGMVRAPGQNCGGFGHCAWGTQPETTASCTPDARICSSTGSGPLPSTRVCTTQGSQRTCTSDNGDPSFQNNLPSLTGTNLNNTTIPSIVMPIASPTATTGTAPNLGTSSGVGTR